MEVIQKKRTEKPEVRDAARQAALQYIFFLSSLEIVVLFYASRWLMVFLPVLETRKFLNFVRFDVSIWFPSHFMGFASFCLLYK